MTLKISDDSKASMDNENPKFKDRFDNNNNKRRNPEHYHSSNKTNNGLHNTTNHYYPSNNSTDQLTSQQDVTNEYLDPEDDSSQSNYRERRNPLPPRFVFSPFSTRRKERWNMNN